MQNLVDNGVARTEQMKTACVDVEELEARSVAVLSSTYHASDILTPCSEQKEHALFKELLRLVPGLEERLFSVKRTEEEFDYIAEMVCAVQ